MLRHREDYRYNTSLYKLSYREDYGCNTSLCKCYVTGRVMCTVRHCISVTGRVMGTSLCKCCSEGYGYITSLYKCYVTGRVMGTSAHSGGTLPLQTSSLSESVPCRSTKLYSVVSRSV